MKIKNMITYTKLIKNKNVFRYFTGLEIEEFLKLFEVFKVELDKYLRQEYKGTKRKFGGGRRPNLMNVEDLLVFILAYYKVYTLQFVQGLLFGIDQSNVCRWIEKLSVVLEKTLGKKLVLPTRDAKSFEEVLKDCPDLQFIIDGTERPMARPKDNKKQKEIYSGKKKTHTKKNVLLTNVKGKIVYLSKTYSGKEHDKSITDQENFKFPDKTKILADLGFLGYENGNTQIIMPYKKPRGKELADHQKYINRIISSVRVDVEHRIGRTKINRIVKDKFRNRRDKFDDQVILISVGLHNYRLENRKTEKVLA